MTIFCSLCLTNQPPSYKFILSTCFSRIPPFSTHCGWFTPKRDSPGGFGKQKASEKKGGSYGPLQCCTAQQRAERGLTVEMGIQAVPKPRVICGVSRQDSRPLLARGLKFMQKTIAPCHCDPELASRETILLVVGIASSPPETDPRND